MNVFHQMSLIDLQKEIVRNKDINPLSAFVADRCINIEKEDWKRLNETGDEKEQLIQYLSDLILNGRIKMPMVDYEYEDAAESFRNLCKYECNGVRTGETFTRYEYEYEISGKYFDESNVGNVASNYFQQENRFFCDSINSPSPYRTWHDRKFLKSALSALWSLKVKEVNMNTLRQTLSLRKYVASQFKPAIAKAVYEYLGGDSILDICSGWGDRLCGFYASKTGKTYVGIDPNTRLHSAYSKQISMYESMVDGKSAMMIKAPAEDVILSPNSFDTVFTSPPYFNIERYSDESTQSFKRYKSLENWLDGFLFKALYVAYNALRSGGYLAINISDVYSNHTINKICDPMNNYIKSLGGKYKECIGMRMAKRPNSGALQGKTGVFVEPIWIWQKTN